MARIDALYLEDLCSGSCRMVEYLAREGILISRDRVRNLLRRMGLRAIYQKPLTTIAGDPAKRFPCLVDLKLVMAVDQVWATDITYIPLHKDFLNLVAIVDLLSRNIISWKLSNSQETEFCLIPWRSHWKAAANQGSSTPIRAASSLLLTSWPSRRGRKSGSAGPDETAVTARCQLRRRVASIT